MQVHKDQLQDRGINMENDARLQAYLDKLQAARQQEAGMQMMANSLAAKAGTNPASMKGIESAAPQAELENYLAQRDADRKMAIVEANKAAPKAKQYKPTKLLDSATGRDVFFDPESASYGYMEAGQWVPSVKTRERTPKGGSASKGKAKGSMTAATGLPVAETKGEKKKDETYAKKYVEWSERRENVVSNVELLNQTIKELEAVAAEERGEGDSGFNTGPLPARLQGRLPDVLQTEDMMRWRNSSDSIAMAKLRESLGSQFTEKEGQKLLSLAYDPALSAEENLKRLKESRKMLENKVSQADEQAKYFETYGTLKGYAPERREAASDLEKVFGEQGKPEAAPHGYKVKQNGKTYIWNGQKYVEEK